MFSSSHQEVSHADLMLSLMLFVDYVMRIADNVLDAQSGLIKLEQVSESKLLQYTMTKTSFIVFGSKTARKSIEKDLERSPLVLQGSKVRETDSEKYLGWILSGKSVEDCAYRTVLRRRGNVRRAISHIKSVIEDSRCRALEKQR